MEEPIVEGDSLKEAFSKDLDIFMLSTQDCLNSVLLFPCINSYSRLKLHELTKEKYPELTSFSVGVEPDRRPIICRQQLIANWTLKSLCSPPEPKPTIAKSIAPPSKKPGKRPEKALYVPGALTGKRPEKALYVPRALRQKLESSENRNYQAETVVSPTLPEEIKTWKDEIYVVTGPAKTVPPLSDYLAFQDGCVTPFDIAFRRVVELGDFPKELKTSDLETVLHSGLVKIKDYYDLRWVDDNHALVIFSDEITASKALRIEDHQIKFKPFYEACEASKAKGKTFALEVEDQCVKRQRPNTSTVMARRLLSRALNNPSIKATQNDESVLNEAKMAATVSKNKTSDDQTK